MIVLLGLVKIMQRALIKLGTTRARAHRNSKDGSVTKVGNVNS